MLHQGRKIHLVAKVVVVSVKAGVKARAEVQVLQKAAAVAIMRYHHHQVVEVGV